MVFKKGHIPWNRGKKTGPLSDEHKKKLSKSQMGENNGFYGKKHTDESKRKISETHSGKRLSEDHKRKISRGKMGKNNPNYGKPAWNKGKKHSKETRHKISEALKGEKNPNYGRIISDDHRRKLSAAQMGEKNHNWGKTLSDEHKRKISEGNKGKKLSEETKQKMREAALKRVFPKMDTSIEVAMQGELGDRGIVFEKHVPLLGKYQVDIKIDDLIVECDGNYWHNFPIGLEKDRRRDAALKEAGYDVLRFWGSEINADVSRCVDNIEVILD